MSDLKITSTSILSLTTGELNASQTILNTGDRSGYDMTYYAMTGVSTLGLRGQYTHFRLHAEIAHESR
jgi:hypothetical protein